MAFNLGVEFIPVHRLTSLGSDAITTHATWESPKERHAIGKYVKDTLMSIVLVRRNEGFYKCKTKNSLSAFKTEVHALHELSQELRV